MKNFKMVCLDIDGTLLNSQHEITDKVKDTIKVIANEKKIPVILVSARMPKGIVFLQKILEIQEPIICYSGALILDKDNNVLANEFIDVSKFEEVYKLVEKYNIHMSVYKADEWYIKEMDYWAKQESEITNITPNIVDFEDLIQLWKTKGTGPNKILCMANPNEISLLKESINSDGLNIYPSKPTYLEIMPNRTSKTSAINCLQRKLIIQQEEIIAIGDNYNDIDMLKYAGLGIAMGNAPDEVKKCANCVTLTNDEDGVAEALKKIFTKIDLV